MTILDLPQQMENAALAYAGELLDRTCHEPVRDEYVLAYASIAVFRYVTYLDNIEPHYRSHREAYGYAVRYSSTAELDREVWRGTDGERRGWPVPKFHDRSLTVFASAFTGLSHRKLRESGGILADIAGEAVTPMYVASWSPSDGPHAPDVPSVIVKRFPARKLGDNYPWQVGPRPMYHMILTAVAS